MSEEQANQLVYGDLDSLRGEADRLTKKFHQPDNSHWIAIASKKQLLAEIIRLYANNQNNPF